MDWNNVAIRGVALKTLKGIIIADLFMHAFYQKKDLRIIENSLVLSLFRLNSALGRAKRVPS